MGNRFKDFDAAIAALDPIEFVVRGEQFKLDKDPPAEVILRMIAEEDLEDGATAVELLRQLVGEDVFTQLIALGVSLTEMNLISQWIAEQCGLELQTTTNGKAASNGGPPASAPKRSSKTGRR